MIRTLINLLRARLNAGKIERGMLFLLAFFFLCSCSITGSETYQNNCNPDILFHKMSVYDLIDSISVYDQKYVEVEGKYALSFEESALYPGGIFLSKRDKMNALWISFDDLYKKCPLISPQTKFYLLDSANTEKIKDKTVLLRGRADAGMNGHLSQYPGGIREITYFEIK